MQHTPTTTKRVDSATSGVVVWLGGGAPGGPEARGIHILQAGDASPLEPLFALAPDLLVLGEGFDRPEELRAAWPGAGAIPVVMIESRATSMRTSGRFGIVGRWPLGDEAAIVEALASFLRQRGGAHGGSATGKAPVLRGWVDGLAARSQKGFVVASGAKRGVLLLGGGAIRPDLAALLDEGATELHFHELCVDRLRSSGAPRSGHGGSAEGARVLVIGDVHADALELAGASVDRLGDGPEALARSSKLMPSVVVLSTEAPLEVPVWDDARLMGASFVVAEPGAEPASIVAAVADAFALERTVRETLAEGALVRSRLEAFGAARWMKLLGPVARPLTLRAVAPSGTVEVELAGGKIKGAKHTDTEGAEVEGRAALSAFLALEVGRLFVGARDQIMACRDELPPEALAKKSVAPATASKPAAETAAAETAASKAASKAAASKAPKPAGAKPAESEAGVSETAAKPAVTKPAVTKPAVTKPAVTKPAVTKPAVTKPAVTKPAVSKPAVTKPAVSKPAVTKPAVTKPAVTKPAVTKPAVSKPASKPKPAVSKPAVSKPAVTKPAVSKPAVTKPAVTKPVTKPAVSKPASKPKPASPKPGALKLSAPKLRLGASKLSPPKPRPKLTPPKTKPGSKLAKPGPPPPPDRSKLEAPEPPPRAEEPGDAASDRADESDETVVFSGLGAIEPVESEEPVELDDEPDETVVFSGLGEIEPKESEDPAEVDDETVVLSGLESLERVEESAEPVEVDDEPDETVVFSALSAPMSSKPVARSEKPDDTVVFSGMGALASSERAEEPPDDDVDETVVFSGMGALASAERADEAEATVVSGATERADEDHEDETVVFARTGAAPSARLDDIGEAKDTAVSALPAEIQVLSKSAPSQLSRKRPPAKRPPPAAPPEPVAVASADVESRGSRSGGSRIAWIVVALSVLAVGGWLVFSTVTEPTEVAPPTQGDVGDEPSEAPAEAPTEAPEEVPRPVEEEPPPSAPSDASLDELLEQVVEAQGARDFALAERLSRQAVAMSPDSGDAHYRLALALFRQRRDDAAMVALERAIELQPRQGLYRLLVGDIHRRYGRFSQARAAWEECVRRQESFTPCSQRLERWQED